MERRGPAVEPGVRGVRLRGGAAWEGKEGCLPVLWRVVRRVCRERWGGEERGERTKRIVEGGEGACLVAWRGKGRGKRTGRKVEGMGRVTRVVA